MATDGKISGLPSVTVLKANDLLLVVSYPFNSSSSQKIDVETLFGNIPVDVNVDGDITISGDFESVNISAESVSVENTIQANTFVVTANSITIQDSFTPANSEIDEAKKGMIFYDNNYLYVTTADGVIKRVDLESF